MSRLEKLQRVKNDLAVSLELIFSLIQKYQSNDNYEGLRLAVEEYMQISNIIEKVDKLIEMVENQEDKGQ